MPLAPPSRDGRTRELATWPPAARPLGRSATAREPNHRAAKPLRRRAPTRGSRKRNTGRARPRRALSEPRAGRSPQRAPRADETNERGSSGAVGRCPTPEREPRVALSRPKGASDAHGRLKTPAQETPHSGRRGFQAVQTSRSSLRAAIALRHVASWALEPAYGVPQNRACPNRSAFEPPRATHVRIVGLWGLRSACLPVLKATGARFGDVRHIAASPRRRNRHVAGSRRRRIAQRPRGRLRAGARLAIKREPRGRRGMTRGSTPIGFTAQAKSAGFVPDADAGAVSRAKQYLGRTVGRIALSFEQ